MNLNQTRIIVALLALIGGEVIIAYTLSLAAKSIEGGSTAIQSLLRFGLPIGVGAFVLLLGYLLGIRSFKSIWVVSVISTASVLVCEPVFAYFVFRTLPQIISSSPYLREKERREMRSYY